MTPVNEDREQVAIRTSAIERHHAEADRFVRRYNDMAKSRFADAFTYDAMTGAEAAPAVAGSTGVEAILRARACKIALQMRRALAETGLLPLKNRIARSR